MIDLVWKNFETLVMKLFGLLMMIVLVSTFSLAAQDTIRITAGKQQYNFIYNQKDTPRTVKISLPEHKNNAMNLASRVAGWVCQMPSGFQQ